MEKLFGKYEVEKIEIKDKSLAQVVSLKPIYIPHSFGRNVANHLESKNVNIVERLANKLMRGGTGENIRKSNRTHGKMQGKNLKHLNCRTCT